ncbi:hypothetical protein GQ457_05G024230 [Hibiscus cannabinus]
MINQGGIPARESNSLSDQYLSKAFVWLKPTLVRLLISKLLGIIYLLDLAERWIMGFTKRIDTCSALEAELWGIFEGLQTTWSLDLRNVIVETDYLKAFNLIMKPSTTGSCSMLTPYIMELIARAWNVQLTHVVREGNVLADMIAKLDLNEDFIVHRLSLPPACCVRLLSKDADARD